MRAVARCCPGVADVAGRADAFVGAGLRVPASFAVREIATNGATIHVRSGGSGPAVVLLHGYGETGDMWAPLAADLARDHTVIVPDLRGLGLSSKPPAASTRRPRPRTSRRHGGAGVGAGRCRRTRHRQHGGVPVRGAVSGARAPAGADRCAGARRRAVGRDPEESLALALPIRRARHGASRRRPRADLPRPILERVLGLAGRASAKRRASTTRKLYALPGAMHSGFAQFAAFDQDAIDNRAFLASGRLKMPILALGGEKSFGPRWRR